MAEIRVRIDARSAPTGIIRRLCDVLALNPGNQHVLIEMTTSQGVKHLSIKHGVDGFSQELLDDLEALTGKKVELKHG